MTEIGTWVLQGAPLRSAEHLPAVRDFAPVLVAIWKAVYFSLFATLGVFVLMLAAVVLPGLWGHAALAVNGGSMGDSLTSGSVAIARWVEPEDVQVGYVIVMNVDGQTRPKIHRVVSLDEENGQIIVQTKGDANETADPGYQILNGPVAVHTYTIPLLGYAIDFVRTPAGWLFLIALPAALVSLMTLRDLWFGDEKTSRAAARRS
ncbi:MAG: signal peptidase I [Chloroflexi bacterium]|nr:signal peptidase I [Chloroflexota bacterium]